MEHYFEEMLMFQTGHTLKVKLATMITNKKYSILTFPPYLATNSGSKSFFYKFFTVFKDYLNI